MELPKHIAFIMDGNRRWAVANGLPKLEGHTKGLENFKNVVRACSDLGIPHLTFWALSTDNLKKREELELKHLFDLLRGIRDYLRDFVEHDAKVEYIGDLTKLPAPLRVVLSDVAQKTKDHKRMTITLGINYGGRDELVRMAKKLVQTVDSSSQTNEKMIDSIIDSGKLPPVDLIVRTGGHHRLSGFLPWIADYAELYFTDRFWPEFSKEDLNTAIEWYGEQVRNFGK
jgi:undecaprenyl diphosphate synthase